MVKSEDPFSNKGQAESMAIIAKLIDYGEIAAVPRHLVQPLLPRFRSLPYQVLILLRFCLTFVIGKCFDSLVWFSRGTGSSA